MSSPCEELVCEVAVLADPLDALEPAQVLAVDGQPLLVVGIGRPHGHPEHEVGCVMPYIHTYIHTYIHLRS